jgi:FkbM family methyltransferase
MKTTLNGTLEDWLGLQIATHEESFKQRPMLIDIGAYHGDFAARFLGDKTFREAILFEPNPTNYLEIEKRFADRNDVKLEVVACDMQSGEREFFCAGETYTGSLLPYGTPTPTPVERSVVQCVTLDSYLNEHALLDKIGLIKIDTQGNDLRVLQGAEEMLRVSRPWIVAELIYVPLYENQGHPHELALWLADYGYTMAAQFNEYYTQNGWLAWSDACFVPKELTATFPDSFLGRPVLPPPKSRRGFLRRLFHN